MEHSGTCDVFDDDFVVCEANLKELKEKYGGQEHPLFMSEVPTDWESNPRYEALRTILYSIQTPEERAASFRKQGNEYFEDAARSLHRRGRYIDAIKCYDEGIKQECKDNKLNSLLHSNRAHVELLLGNFVACVDDCRRGIQQDSQNLKAYYRAAKASYRLQLWGQCVAFCNDGLKVDRENEELINLAEAAESRLQQREKQDPFDDEHRRKRISGLNEAYNKRGLEVLQFCNYDITLLDIDSHHKYDQETDVLHWPCLFLYPAVQVSETILDFSDNTTILDQLRVMLPADQSIPWDSRGKHSYDQVSVYYEGAMSDGTLVKVDLDVPLRNILSVFGRVARVPIFHVVPTDSEDVLLSGIPHCKMQTR